MPTVGVGHLARPDPSDTHVDLGATFAMVIGAQGSGKTTGAVPRLVLPHLRDTGPAIIFSPNPRDVASYTNLAQLGQCSLHVVNGEADCSEFFLAEKLAESRRSVVLVDRGWSRSPDFADTVFAACNRTAALGVRPMLVCDDAHCILTPARCDRIDRLGRSGVRIVLVVTHPTFPVDVTQNVDTFIFCRIKKALLGARLCSQLDGIDTDGLGARTTRSRGSTEVAILQAAFRQQDRTCFHPAFVQTVRSSQVDLSATVPQ